MTEPELCRLCAETKENVIGIYDAEGQKLAIEAKIAKCLRFQILINDRLPLKVCIDCCILLNQCSEFVEKANQAQLSLRRLLVNPKQSLNSRTDYDDKTVAFPKQEDGIAEDTEECHSSSNYDRTRSDDSSNCLNEDKKDDNLMECVPVVDVQDATKQKKCKVQLKKPLLKQAKRKVKKKVQNQSNNSDMCRNEDTKEEDGNIDMKVNIKIPDNYMTGTDSDLEILEAHTAEVLKLTQKREEGVNRYPWICSDCTDKLPSLEKLKEHHENVHNQQAKYMCVLCCKVYDKYYGFLTHVKRHKNKTKYSCENCGKSFVNKKVLDSHKAIHSEERPHVCQTCGKAFKQQSALYIHSRSHLPDTMKNKFPCDQCGKRFSTKPNLVTHKRIHSGIRNFTCDQCGKSFIQKGNLEAHFLTHSVVKPYKCTQCSKAFKTPLQLKKHETVHTGAKPHQCAVCGRTFREKGTLREHHRIHTGAMPFTCEFCGKCFRFRGILITHRRQHTGERPYSCLECQHHFTNWPNYNKHMKRRHGINTSHTKHMPQSDEMQSQQHLQQSSEELQTVQTNTSENSPPVSHTGSSTVHVIQTISHASTSQPIVVQTISNSNVQNLQADVCNTVQDTALRERNATYFNAVPASLQNYLPPNLSYNFYNISNVTYKE